MRLFSYCFLSLMPVLFNPLVDPSSPLLFVLSVQIIHSTHGILLFALSAAVRKKMPFQQRAPAITGIVGETTRAVATVEGSKTARGQTTATMMTVTYVVAPSPASNRPRVRINDSHVMV